MNRNSYLKVRIVKVAIVIEKQLNWKCSTTAMLRVKNLSHWLCEIENQPLIDLAVCPKSVKNILHLQKEKGANKGEMRYRDRIWSVF